MLIGRLRVGLLIGRSLIGALLRLRIIGRLRIGLRALLGRGLLLRLGIIARIAGRRGGIIGPLPPRRGGPLKKELLGPKKFLTLSIKLRKAMVPPHTAACRPVGKLPEIARAYPAYYTQTLKNMQPFRARRM